MVRTGMASTGTTEFVHLQFGKADARKEAVMQPDLLRAGFYDAFNLPARLISGDVTVLLGPKGSGKSAIVEHLELESRESSNTFVTRYDLYDFPYREFVQLEAGGAAAEARLPTVWNWVLLLALMISFNQDLESASRGNPDFQKAIGLLEKLGFLSGMELRQVVTESSTASFGSAVKNLFVFTKTRQSRGLAIPAATESLRRLVFDFRSKAVHLVVLDGLDKQFVSGQVPWEELAALVLAADKLNLDFFEHAVPARIVILIRPDMYDRLPSGETPKIRQDSGFHLSWYPSSERPQDSELFLLFSQKAATLSPDVNDVISEYLPPTIKPRGSESRHIPIHDYLMERTRHTPRDLGQLLSAIQGQARREKRAGRLPESTVIDGASQYGRNYFYGDVIATLRGLGFSHGDIDCLMGLLKAMPGDFFSRRAILEKAKERSLNLDDKIDEMLRQLYEAGAIANKLRGGRVNFLHRQSTGELDVGANLVMHRALAVGLNKRALWIQG